MISPKTGLTYRSVSGGGHWGLESIKNPKKRTSDPPEGTFSEGGVEESIKNPKKRTSDPPEGTFSEGGVEESIKNSKKRKSDLPEGTFSEGESR